MQEAAITKNVICGKCGEIKGSENCCKPDVAKCKKCGLNKSAQVVVKFKRVPKKD